MCPLCILFLSSPTFRCHGSYRNIQMVQRERGGNRRNLKFTSSSEFLECHEFLPFMSACCLVVVFMLTAAVSRDIKSSPVMLEALAEIESQQWRSSLYNNARIYYLALYFPFFLVHPLVAEMFWQEICMRSPTTKLDEYASRWFYLNFNEQWYYWDYIIGNEMLCNRITAFHAPIRWSFQNTISPHGFTFLLE